MRSPPGFADPFSVAVAPVSAVAPLVDTVGAAAGVVNDCTVPNDVPYVLLAIAQK